ncbi:MAG: hypothetical protein K2X86_17780 [Cytophagaceae bacterium]|nr:hypothetical protein [Cytophagaceae bacterium]
MTGKLRNKIRSWIKGLKEKSKIIEGEKPVGTHFSSWHDYSSPEEAGKVFKLKSEKFLQIDGWNEFSGKANASFELYDSSGNKTSGQLKKGYYIKIDLPGPVPMYWVQIEKVSRPPDFLQIIVRPSHDPTSEKEANTTVHFFQSEAVSIFTLKRYNNRLYAAETGKNEKINKKEPESGEMKAVNTIVAASGWAGVQKIQWKTFTKNLVAPE